MVTCNNTRFKDNLWCGAFTVAQTTLTAVAGHHVYQYLTRRAWCTPDPQQKTKHICMIWIFRSDKLDFWIYPVESQP